HHRDVETLKRRSEDLGLRIGFGSLVVHRRLEWAHHGLLGARSAWIMTDSPERRGVDHALYPCIQATFQEPSRTENVDIEKSISVAISNADEGCEMIDTIALIHRGSERTFIPKITLGNLYIEPRDGLSLTLRST